MPKLKLKHGDVTTTGIGRIVLRGIRPPPEVRAIWYSLALGNTAKICDPRKPHYEWTRNEGRATKMKIEWIDSDDWKYDFSDKWSPHSINLNYLKHEVRSILAIPEVDLNTGNFLLFEEANDQRQSFLPSGDS